MTVFHQPENRRIRITLLNRQDQTPPIPVRDLVFSVRPPEGFRFVRVLRVPDQIEAPFETDEEGCLHVRFAELVLLAMFVADYVPAEK